MIVFDSYVNLFQKSNRNSSDARTAELNRRNFAEANTPLDNTISRSAYVFASMFDRVWRKN